MKNLTEAFLNGETGGRTDGAAVFGGRDREGCSLDFSHLNIELSVKKGETAEGIFTIYGPQDVLAEGSIYSSELRMECLDREFIGTEEKIRYRFRSEGMEEGERLEGLFCIISNCGEYELPYRVAVETQEVPSSLGNIRNMFHFANLAKSKWEEAVRIFYSKEFGRIFSGGNEKQYYSLYRGLSAVPGNEQNVEEFLIEINKKQRVEYVPDVEEICIEDPDGAGEYGISLQRNGWGHTFLRVETDGDFLLPEKEKVTDSDFTGNSFRLRFRVDGEKLHMGRNYGRIRIYNSCTELSIPVMAVLNGERRRAFGIRREKKRLLVQMMDYYLAFRMRKISTRTWMSETEKLVEKLSAVDEKDIRTILYRAQLLITQERYNEAKWLLDRIRSDLDAGNCPPEIWCYYLYLTTLYSRDGREIDEAAGRVERIFKANSDNWRIAWLLLYLSEEYGKSMEKRFLVLEEQFAKGCTSPVLYVEAWHLLEMNPTLLLKLSSFEIHVLYFAAKRELLTKDVIVQLCCLVEKKKEYSGQLFSVLRECYEKYPDNDTLKAICTLLIKGNRTDSSFFEWYRLGVEQELRITRLYEYYMMALPDNFAEELPKVIVMYFAYNSDLDYRKNAFLYAYIYRRRKEQPELYLSYCERMEQFVLEQIRRERIDENLAYLYRNLLVPRLVDEETANRLARLIFMNRITVSGRDIRMVAVRCAISRREEEYPVIDGRAWVPLYGSDNTVFLEDREGNRYVHTVPYRVDKMMLPGKLIPLITPYVKDNTGLAVFMCEGDRALGTVTEENEPYFKSIAKADWIEEEYKNEINRKLMHYYYEGDHIRELDAWLDGLSPEAMPDTERNEVIRFMIIRGMYDKAFAWVRRYGADGVDAKNVVRLVSRLLARDGYVEDEAMTDAAFYAFRNGKYDGNLLTCLVCFYNGTIKQMRDIWKAAVAFELDTYALCERMIVQMLYSGSFVGERMDIFRTYVSGGAKPQIEAAFLSQCSFDYFVKEKLTDPFIFTDTARVYERGEKTEMVCKLALLKYYAENRDQITPATRAVIRQFLCDTMDENLFFPFFREYAGDMPVMAQFEDKTMIEYRTRPGVRAMIHYIIERGEHTETEYRKEEMKNMFGGICVKAFVLFFGERLQYYITEEADGKEQLTESASVSKSDIMQEAKEDRFNLINDIVVSRTLQDYDTVDCLLEEYYKKKYITSRVFQLRQ